MWSHGRCGPGHDPERKILINVVALLVVLVALVSMTSPGVFCRRWRFGPCATHPDSSCGPSVGRDSLERAHAAGELMGTKIRTQRTLAYLDTWRPCRSALYQRGVVITRPTPVRLRQHRQFGHPHRQHVQPAGADQKSSNWPRSILAGVLTTLMTGAVVGVLW